MAIKGEDWTIIWSNKKIRQKKPTKKQVEKSLVGKLVHMMWPVSRGAPLYYGKILEEKNNFLVKLKKCSTWEIKEVELKREQFQINTSMIEEDVF